MNFCAGSEKPVATSRAKLDNCGLAAVDKPLFLHAAECRVYVWVIAAKPVAEGAPQQAGGGARRSAFHDVMFAIEEIGRVAGICFSRLKARQRTEDRSGPFPSIPNQLTNAKRTIACGRGVNRLGFPVLE